MKNKYFSNSTISVLVASLVLFILLCFIIFILTQIRCFNYNIKESSISIPRIVEVLSEVTESEEKIVPRRTLTPEYVRGIYLTAYSANRSDWIERIILKIKEGKEINSVVIDIKDYTGYVLYDSQLEDLNKYKMIKVQINDVKSVIKKFHDANIYVIARLTAFQDPALAKARPDLAIKTKAGGTWYNYSGLAFTDPQKKEVWDIYVAIAKEAVSLGFDEINFDYMRYPSDGNIKNIQYNLPAGTKKADMMEKFYSYLSKELTPLTKISIDLFGMVMDNVDSEYDLGIGQTLSSTFDYFDYICPMMYPSHYPDNYLNLENPAVNPSLVISYGINKASPNFEGKRASLRPWLQAFNIGAVYNKVMIDAETNATESATSTSGWLLWNARNYYEDHIFIQ